MKYMKTGDVKRVSSLVEAACSEQAMVAINGERGVGKTTAVNQALGRPDLLVVQVLRLRRERLHIGDIEFALIAELSGESARCSAELRARQLRRILGEASERRRIVLFIDDAHVLHHSTLRALKRLRELSWMGRAPLLGIVLVAQRDPTQGIDEVALRTDEMVMAGLTEGEAQRVIKARAGELGIGIDTAAIPHISARNWLDIAVAIRRAAGRARAAGRQTITQADLGGTQRKDKTERDISDEAISHALGSRQVA